MECHSYDLKILFTAFKLTLCTPTGCSKKYHNKQKDSGQAEDQLDARESAFGVRCRFHGFCNIFADMM